MSTNNFDFSLYLQQNQQQIDQLLAKILPHSASQHKLFDAMRYSVLNGGKRLRPTLVYAIGDVLTIPHIHLHAAALSVELIHCYSLIHDDLPAMDDDDLRRGKPTCHKAFDEATAILAGDALQSLAFQVLSDPELNLAPPAKHSAMINLLAKASGAMGMVLGQAEDLAAEQRQLGLAELSSLHKHKTGALFNVCIELSLLASPQEISTQTCTQLLTYGSHLGLAFQIHDDVLDVIGDQEIIGKPVGSDQKHAKSTFTSLLGIDDAKAKANENLHLALAAIAQLEHRTEVLAELAKYLISRTH